MQNKKGFVLIETLVVTIFTMFIFTVLYNTVVPLLGKYKELSYHDDLDTTYDLYYLKEYIRKDANYELIELENYQEITCDSLTNKEECLNIYDFLDIKSTDEILFVNTNALEFVYNDSNISTDIKNYLKYLDTESENIILLQKDGYISYLNIRPFDETAPICTIDISNNSKTSGVTTTVTCDDGDGSGCRSDNPTGDIDLKTSKTYTVYDYEGNSGTCTINVKSQLQKRTCSTANWSSATKDPDITSCSERSKSSANSNLKDSYWTCDFSHYTYSGTCYCSGNSMTNKPYSCNATAYSQGCSSYCSDKGGGDGAGGHGSCSRTTKYDKYIYNRIGCSKWSGWSNESSCSKSANKVECQTIYIGTV